MDDAPGRPPGESLRKRVTLLGRRDDLSREQFQTHWRVTHGPIAAGFRGLVRYLQNAVVSEWSSERGRPWPVDGIVELWFDQSAGSSPGRDPDVTARLVADEPRFLSTLTGFEVTPAGLYPPAATKVWILGRWRTAAQDPDLLGTCARALERTHGALTAVQVTTVPPAIEPFSRDALAVFDTPPRAMTAFGWTGDVPTPADLADIGAVVQELSGGDLTDLQVLTTDCVQVV